MVNHKYMPSLYQVLLFGKPEDINQFDRDYLTLTMKLLTPDQARVMKMRFGLEGKIHTVSEIATEMDIYVQDVKDIIFTSIHELGINEPSIHDLVDDGN